MAFFSPIKTPLPPSSISLIKVYPFFFDKSDKKSDEREDESVNSPMGSPAPFLLTPILNLRDAFMVLQKCCAISRSRPLATSSFGPCYIVTIYDPTTKWTLMAHIDDATVIGSFTKCCESYLSLLGEDFEMSQLRVDIRGGWKDNDSSTTCGKNILEELFKMGIQPDQLDLSDYQKKTFGAVLSPFSTAHHFAGGIFDPGKGNFTYFPKIWEKIETASNTFLHQSHNLAFMEEIEEYPEVEKEDLLKKQETIKFNLSLPLKLDILN